MNKGLYFVLGLACGAAGAYLYLKDRYERYAQEEIDSVKEAYGKKLDEIYGATELVQEPEKDGFSPVHLKSTKPDLMEFAKIVREKNYTSYATKVETPEDQVHKKFSEDPEYIKPDEFGEIEDYEKVSLNYFADGILADEIDDEIFEDAEEKLGDFVSHFGEHEDNAVYIRNDIDKVDYYIFKDERSYEEVTGKKPHLEKQEE
jgi:hypothetical protein